MFARFDENPAMTLQDIKKTKRYGRKHAHTDARTDNMKTVYPPQTFLQTKFAVGIIILRIISCCENSIESSQTTFFKHLQHITVLCMYKGKDY